MHPERSNDVKLLQLANAATPIDVSSVHAERSADVKLVQPLNALSPIDVNPAGWVTVVKLVLPYYALSPSVVSSVHAERSTDVKGQPLKMTTEHISKYPKINKAHK